MTGRLIEYLGQGLVANRPVTPDIAADALAVYYATDESKVYAWNDSSELWDVVGALDAAVDGMYYLRLNGEWAMLPDYPDVPDVPASDAIIYGIKDGAWFAIPAPALNIADLDDVDLTGLADGFVLKWDVGSSTWKAAAESGGGGGGGGAIPTIVQSAYARNGSTATATFAGNTTVGNVILLLMSGARDGHDPSPLWQNIVYGADGGGWTQSYQKLYACLIPCDGTAQSFTVPSGDVVNLGIFEIAGGHRASGHTGSPDTTSGWKLPCMQEAVGAGLHFVVVEQDNGGPLVMGAQTGLTQLHQWTGGWNHDGLLILVDDTVFENHWISGTGNGAYISYMGVTVAA